MMYKKMGNSYIQAVEKKLKKLGYSEEQISVEIKKIMNPNIMEEEVEVVDDVNMPIVEEEIIEVAPEIIEEAEEMEEEEEEKVDTDEE